MYVDWLQQGATAAKEAKERTTAEPAALGPPSLQLDALLLLMTAAVASGVLTVFYVHTYDMYTYAYVYVCIHTRMHTYIEEVLLLFMTAAVASGVFTVRKVDV
jgi:hypothetical protein